MSVPIRVQLKRRKGWKMPPNTVKVDRTTKWGNPFIVGEQGKRVECVYLFRLLCIGAINISCGLKPGIQEAWIAHAGRNIWRLRGKNLACWCPLGSACHADVLLEIANK